MSTLEIAKPGSAEVLQWDEEDPAQVEAARKRFDAEMSTGGLAYKTESPGKSSQIREFDPEAREMTITRPLVGG